MDLRFRYVWLILFILLAAPPAVGADDSVENFQEITWEELIPESARGTSFFEGLNLNQPSNSDIAADQALNDYLEKRNQSPANISLNGREIKISGFVVPLEWNAEAALTEFLLVPYFGACIHIPPPPVNQIIYVKTTAPSPGLRAMDNVSVSGRIQVEEMNSPTGNAAYSLQAARVESGGGRGFSRLARAVVMTAFCGLSLCLGLGLTQFMGTEANARPFGLALSFAAGIMTALGFSIVVVKFSWAALIAFASGGLTMACLDFMFHQSWKSGQFAALAVAAHNIPECFAVFSVTMASPSLGLVLGGAMIAHNIPLGFSFVLADGSSRWRYALTAGIVPVPAAVFLYLLARPLLSPDNLNFLFSFAGGLMVFVAVRAIWPLARRFTGRPLAASGCCAGIVFMISMLLAFRL